MSNFDAAIQIKNRKMVVGINLDHPVEINPEPVRARFQEALILDKKKK